MFGGLLKKVQLTFDEQLPKDKKGRINPDFPLDGQCRSGHKAPPNTRFFRVSGSALPRDRWGIYCEHCLAVANRLAAKQKQSKLSDDPNLDELIQQAERSTRHVRGN